MRQSKTPRFILDGPCGCKTIGTADDVAILAAFSSLGAATSYCEADRAANWELCPLDLAWLKAHTAATRAERPPLVAIDPVDAGEFLLWATTTDALALALQNHEDTVPVEYRLLRDCAKQLWRSEKVPAGEDRRAGGKRWYVACRYPKGMTLLCGAPMWFWLEWFEGRHVRTEHQADAGDYAEQIQFAFDCQRSAEGFGRATVARLDGSVHHCYLDRHRGDEFAVAVWEDGLPASVCARGTIGEKLHKPALNAG